MHGTSNLIQVFAYNDKNGRMVGISFQISYHCRILLDYVSEKTNKKKNESMTVSLPNGQVEGQEKRETETIRCFLRVHIVLL